MKNRDTSHISNIYEQAILIKGPLDSILGGMGAMPSQYGDMGGEVSDDHNPREVDESEIHMARSELKKLSEYSAKLYDKIDELDGLEGWVASKITKASDYISSVYHWLDYEHQDDECGCHDHEDYDDEDEEMMGY